MDDGKKIKIRNITFEIPGPIITKIIIKRPTAFPRTFTHNAHNARNISQ